MTDDNETGRYYVVMKYSWDTFKLYQGENFFTRAVRISVKMKETVDRDVLDTAVNTAIKRYPYFAVCVSLDDDGGYVLLQNHRRVVVLHSEDRIPKLGSESVNRHLLFVECRGKQISFHISHSICGGRGFLPWVMTSIYQYVVEKYHVTPYAPGIRKPEDDLLPGENDEPSFAMLSEDSPIYRYKSKNPVVLKSDYMNGLINPFRRSPNYCIYSFSQNDIISFMKSHDASVAAFFLVVMAKALDRILPEKDRVIGGEIAHNPSAALGRPYSHFDLLSHVHIDYEREKLNWDFERLGTMTRGQMILQTDPSVSSEELRKNFVLFEELEQIRGNKDKRKCMKKHDPSSGKDAKHGTYVVNYSGQMDWGEVADYVDSYVIIVEGHLILEVTSMKDRIFVSFMQLLNEKKYRDAWEGVLKELGIPFKVKGPYQKRLSVHELPRQNH